MIIRIDTLDDPRLDAYARLTEVQLRSKLDPAKGIFIAESAKVIQRAFDAGMQPISLLMEEKWLESMGPLIERMEQSLAIRPVAGRLCVAESSSEAGRPEAGQPASEGLPVFVAPREQLERLTGFELTRGALGAFRRPPLRSVAEVCEGARRIAVLEDITNHTNVGAIFRSAAALNVDAVLVTPACYDPLYRRAVRVSMGTVFQVPWTRIGDADAAPAVADAPLRGSDGLLRKDARGRLAGGDEARRVDSWTQTSAQRRVRGGGGGKAGESSWSEGSWAESGIPLLKSLGFTTAAMALSDDSVPIDHPALAVCDKLAIILGTEGDGLAPRTIAQCDYTVRIPMAHGVDSLNVAAASAVAFWELRVR